MAQQYTRQHKRGRKSFYTGIRRGSSFFVVLARCGAFPRTFPPHWKKYARKHEKGLFLAIFRHWQQATNKKFSFGDQQAKKADFSKE